MLDVATMDAQKVVTNHHAFKETEAVGWKDGDIAALDLSNTNQHHSFETHFDPIVIINVYGIDFGFVNEHETGRHLCRVCWREFQNNETQKCHEKRHTLQRDFRCELCTKTFIHYSNLRRHWRSHAHDRPFQCDICSKKFNRKCDLGVHQRIHSGEQSFTCPICSKKFTYASNLNAHIRIHNDGKPFLCLKCKKCFNQLRYLKRHMKVHLKNAM